MRGRGRGPRGDVPTALQWTGRTLGVLVLASAFVPFSAGLTRGLSWVVCLYALLGCGIAIGRLRQGSFLAFAAAAVLMNPFVPFHFPAQVWRLIYAGVGLWLLADQLPRRD